MAEGIVLYSKQHESKSWQLGTGLHSGMALEDLRDAVIWEIFMTKKDWYEAGDQIRNLVQDAIDKEDFSQLSSTISNVVNDTMSGLEKALKDSLGNGTRQPGGAPGAEKDSSGAQDARYSGGQTAQDQADGQTGTAGSNRGGRTQSESGDQYRNRRPYQTWTTQARQEAADRIRVNMEKTHSEHAQKKNTSLVPVKAPGRVSGTVMKWVGYSCSGMFGLSLAILGAVGAATGVSLAVPVSILGVLFAGSLGLGIGGKKRLELAQRFRKYVSVLGNRTYCMVEELADSVGESSKFVRKDLKKMIRQGFFPQGYLDQKETCLITDKQTYQQYQDAQQSYEARKKAAQQNKDPGRRDGDGQYFETAFDSESSGGSENAAAKRSGTNQNGAASGHFADSDIRADLDPKCAELIAQGRSYIRHIHECNDRIPDEAMSEKLARLEVVVTRIFTEAERNPEVVDDLKKMMSYYLPTTKKLLDAYCNLNEQPVGGQNIDTMKKEIEETLDTLNSAFEKLLDDLFEEQAWDISSDISVLNTMLAQEGLTGNRFERK